MAKMKKKLFKKLLLLIQLITINIYTTISNKREKNKIVIQQDKTQKEKTDWMMPSHKW